MLEEREGDQSSVGDVDGPAGSGNVSTVQGDPCETARVLIRGDARFLPLKDKSVHMCCTSPPYFGLRRYDTGRWQGGDADHKHDTVGARNGRGGSGTPDKRDPDAFPDQLPVDVCSCGAMHVDLQIGLEQTPADYVASIVTVFREVKRVLRDDGVAFVVIGDSYNNAGSCRNGEGLDGSRRGGATGPDGALGYKKRDTRHSLGTIKHKDLIGIPWMVAFALRDDGWYLRSDLIWSCPNKMPESVTDRCSKSHEYIFMFSKKSRYFFDAQAIAEPVSAAMIMEMEQGYDGLGLKDYEGAGVQNPSSVKSRIIANARRKSEAAGVNGRNVQATNSEAERRDELGSFNNNPRKRYQGKHAGTNEQDAGNRVLSSVADARAAGAPHDAPFGPTRNKRSIWVVPDQLVTLRADLTDEQRAYVIGELLRRGWL